MEKVLANITEEEYVFLLLQQSNTIVMTCNNNFAFVRPLSNNRLSMHHGRFDPECIIGSRFWISDQRYYIKHVYRSKSAFISDFTDSAYPEQVKHDILKNMHDLNVQFMEE